MLNGRRLVGTKLAKTRVAKGLTQRELAELVGRTADTIASLENGRKQPSPTTLVRLCEALQCSRSRITEKVDESE